MQVDRSAADAVEAAADYYQKRIRHAGTTYEQFTAYCDWLFNAARRAGTLQETIDKLELMIEECDRRATQ